MFGKKEKESETTDPLYDPDMIPADVFEYERRYQQRSEWRRPLWRDFDWRGFDESCIIYFIVFVVMLLLCATLSAWFQGMLVNTTW
jgi:hypothetical protein